MEEKNNPDMDSCEEKKREDGSHIAKKLIKLLVSKKRPVPLREIFDTFDDDKEKISAMFETNKDKFSLYKEPFVDLNIKIDICKEHCSSKLTCKGCSDLHVCKFFALSGNCDFRRNCSFGHDLTTEHNRKVLDENSLSNISTNELNYLFKRAINRKVPEICKFYNVQDGRCKHSQADTVCPYLHICRHYVYGTCRYKRKCLRSHKILDQNNEEILRKNGIDTTRKEKDIVKELRTILEQHRPKEDTTEVYENESIGCLVDRKVDQVKKETIELDISLSSDNSDDNMNPSADVLKVKQKQQVEGEGESNRQNIVDPEVCVTILSDGVVFRYKSQLKVVEKGAEGKQDGQEKLENDYLASVSITNYAGKATVVAFCVDSNGNIHPFCLYGTKCDCGVYRNTCLVEPNIAVKLHGVSILMPLQKEYHDKIKDRNAYLNNCGVTDTNICDVTKNNHLVYIKVVVFLEDSGKKISDISSPIRNKSNIRRQRDNENIGVKRAFDCTDNGVNAKKRKESLTESFPNKKLFQRFYSRQNTSPWGNFIDSSGYEESALTWQAHGEALQSVCMICFPGGSATGFRVGYTKNYIMTAAHVVTQMEQTGFRRIGRPNRASLANADIYAEFGYLKEGVQQIENRFTFTGTVHFSNAETDTAILELSESAYGTPMPLPFAYFRAPDFTKKFFFIGHSEGKPLAINKVNKIVDMNSKESKIDTANVRKWSKSHTTCKKYPQGRECEVWPFNTLTNKNRFLFHCKFTKGASGSPGIVCLNDGRKVVVTMLLGGYPEWYYDPSMEKYKENWCQDRLCIEQGVKLQSVYEIMNKENAELCKEIFGQETDN